MMVAAIFFAQVSPVAAQSSTAAANASDTASPQEGSEPSLDDLISILENEETRAKLLESLKAAAYQAPEEGGEDGALLDAPDPDRTLPARIAEGVRSFIGSIGETGSEVLASVRSSGNLLSGAGSLDIPAILEAVLPVGLVAIVVFFVLGLGRLVKAPIFRSLAETSEHASPLNKLLLLALSGFIDALSIVLSWAAGVVAASVFANGQPGFNQQLFLNAFLVIEMIKVSLGLFVSPNYPGLRLTPFSNRQASYWYFWLSRFISILGYTFLFVAPVIRSATTVQAADATRFIVVVICVLIGISLILKNRGTVRERLKRAKKEGDRSVGAHINAFIGQIWWVVAIGFVLAAFIVWLRSPEEGLSFLTIGTLKTIAAMAVGGLIVSVLSRWITSGIPIPESVKDKLPLLEKRVNSFIPNALTVIRVFVVIAVLAYVLEAWTLASYSTWLASDMGQSIVGGLIGAGIILVIGVAIYIAVSSWIEYRLNPNYGTIPTARERTLLSLFRNAFTITMVVVVAMLVLSQVGIDIAPLLAGAGVVGLAIGFGAQKFVQDIITGAFIQIQNAMNEGDIVEVNGVTGTVEQLTVRSVGLRTIDGTWCLIPFSSVDQVANYSKDFAYYVADIGVAYREDTADVEAMMVDAFEELKTTAVADNLIGNMEMWGVQELGDSAVVMRGRVMTKPGTQWGVGRAYRGIIKRMADERGIEIPFPHMTVWFGEDRKGNAPPIRMTDPETSAPKIEAERADRLQPQGAAPSSSTDYGTSDVGGKTIPPGGGDVDAAGPGRG
ncbi:Small-conductance mechanosensitive ion channel [Fulvimarina pelagi HTCC2506]|uniref:Small-conductance mechanosensitive ion channel n=2 Tax=Fulvimarina pelagi TaxID=217511 RepID=Q0FZM6_9HYPH|nr:Small-conductance mechanosensitive ion channel [Fulvimarina pelagi HTCC2506]